MKRQEGKKRGQDEGGGGRQEGQDIVENEVLKQD